MVLEHTFSLVFTNFPWPVFSQEKVNGEFDALFETGVDEMSWDEMVRTNEMSWDEMVRTNEMSWDEMVKCANYPMQTISGVVKVRPSLLISV